MMMECVGNRRMSEKENQEMDVKEKKAAQEENVKDEKIELADDDAEKAAGGRSPMRLEKEQLRIDE